MTTAQNVKRKISRENNHMVGQNKMSTDRPENSSAQNLPERGKNVDLYIDEDIMNDFRKMSDKSRLSAEEIEEMEKAKKVIFYGMKFSNE
jgi:hypothetical protein